MKSLKLRKVKLFNENHNNLLDGVKTGVFEGALAVFINASLILI